MVVFIKEFGFYLLGCMVCLKLGEVGMVMCCGESVNMLLVVVLIDCDGNLWFEFVWCDIVWFEFSIVVVML